jgi:GT2 family glycosyltransferase
MTSISIIIVNFNTKDLLKNCLKSIYEKTSGLSYEIFVVDNASSDSSCAMVQRKFKEVHLIRNNENKGFAVANNQAILSAEGKYIVLLNSDTILVNNALKFLYDFMEHHDSVGICGPQLLNTDRSIQKSIAEFPSIKKIIGGYITFGERFKSLHYFNQVEPQFYSYKRQKKIVDGSLTGACLMIRRRLFKEFGLLDEQYFFYLEEADWSFSVIKKGWEIWIVPEAKVVHYLMASVKQNNNTELEIKIKTRQVKSLIYFYRKHYGQCNASLLKIVLLLFFLQIFLDGRLNILFLPQAKGRKYNLK